MVRYLVGSLFTILGAVMCTQAAMEPALAGIGFKVLAALLLVGGILYGSPLLNAIHACSSSGILNAEQRGERVDE